MQGLFITLEGGEGSGKTTLLKLLHEQLTKQGWNVVTTREPGGSRLGETIRDWVLQSRAGVAISSKAELLLFLAARAQHIQELILPALQQKKIVLCDRFNDSTIAYQGGARGLGIDYVKSLCDAACGEVVPSLTLLLDVSPEIGLMRSKGVEKKHASAGELDRIESENLQFHLKISEAFRYLAKKENERIHVINANHPFPQVIEEAFSIVGQRISLHKALIL